MTTLTKIVNGIEMPLTPEDIAQMEADHAAFIAAAPQRELQRVLEIRQREYGTVGEQLDMIFHQGLDTWKAHIQRVKDENPKPVL